MAAIKRRLWANFALNATLRSGCRGSLRFFMATIMLGRRGNGEHTPYLLTLRRGLIVKFLFVGALQYFGVFKPLIMGRDVPLQCHPGMLLCRPCSGESPSRGLREACLDR